MFAAGVSFAAPVDFRRDAPWALELTDGNHCLLAQGAHDWIKTKHAELVVDYYCDRNHLFRLRNMTRGPVWRIGAATHTGRRYRLRGRVAIRRAIFPVLASGHAETK